MDEGTLNDLLECSVCLERLDTSSKVLPCQHTFCKKCLEEIVQTHKELRCPECRVLVLVKVDELPPNVLLMRILEGIKNAGNFLPKKINRPARAPNLLPTAVAHTTPLHTPHSTPDHRINSNKQQLLPHQPYAKAMYDYTSKETGDLNFKRGDVIILKKRIDTNWYQGECGGKQGVFPLSYVQIITPVPSHIPQCKALYDFRMANDEEEGCLSFNKGDIISVIRRVDENWAEGKLNGRIGIFPLAFVELNNLARSLMKLSTNAQPGPSRVAPPTPTSEDTSPLIPTDHTRNVIPQQVQQQPPVPMARAPVPNQQHAPLAASDSSSTLSSGTSGGTSNISSANASSGNTSSSSSSPSPSSPASPPPPKGQQTLPPKNTMRPDLLNTGKLTTPQRSPQNQPRPVDPHVTSHHPHQHSKEKRHSFTGLGTTHHPNPLTPNQNRLSAEIVQGSDSQMAISNDRRGRAGHLSEMQLPATYVALYPYKPQKADELELKKGGIYMVTEICHDGWYKGTSNRTQKCGVFPGNYVTPARGVPNPQGAKDSAESKLPVSFTRSGKNSSASAQHAASTNPPELPARATSPSSNAFSSSWHGGQQDAQAVPLGRSSSAIMTGGNNAVNKTDKSKERKEKGTVSLMKRLTSMKRSKSPPPSSYSMDNPVFEDTSMQAAKHSATPVHVRSGSCPSQLLQIQPNDHHRIFGSTSQRHKHKERPTILTHSPSITTRNNENPAGSSGSSPDVQRHRKSNSLDAGNKSKTVVQTVRERFRCIAPYPPNSEYELELQVNDIIYVHKKREDGWYKGTQQRTGKTGLFPASFVESY
ncbi:E3 ubiquitin-protein ligase SH3RF1 isoform X2 [Diabrotica virgifera virgifera]|uniref:RING-type E3 ubiquitin transferase n=1 Tax=Diabrotica virgifera virgifera TaxID=50390 RepID=A0ABM5K0S0_DIAVI|nr:E3 ubiquitin-protein ligase SH3RF1 isoform X2 [Diabrotica virgifera virgifera]